MAVDPKPSCANSVGHWDLVERHGVLNGKGRKQLHCDCESTEAWGKQNRNKYTVGESKVERKHHHVHWHLKGLTKKLKYTKITSIHIKSEQNKIQVLNTHYQLISSDSLFSMRSLQRFGYLFQGPWPVVLTQFSGLGSVDWCFLGDMCNDGNLRPSPTLEPMSEIFNVIFSSNCQKGKLSFTSIWNVGTLRGDLLLCPIFFQNTRCSVSCSSLVKLHGNSTVIHCNEAQCRMIWNGPRLNRPEISSPSPQT